ncbi:MAG: HDIG domain-containing protein [Planctomycetes bacterium]|nr:HDIG domain-containing protein [Planctomycetota bacterium]
MRRVDPRRAPATAGPSAWRSFRQAGGPGAILIVLILYAGAAFLDLWPDDPLPYRLGQYIPENIHPRVDFRVLLQERLKDARRVAEDSAAPVLALNVKLIEEVSATLSNLPERLKNSPATRPADLDKSLLDQFALDDMERINAFRALAASEPGARKKLAEMTDRIKSAMAECYIVRPDDLLKQPTAEFVAFSRPGRDGKKDVVYKPIRDPRTKIDNPDIIKLHEQARIGDWIDALVNQFDKSLRPSLKAYLAGMLKARPACIYDDAASSLEKQRKVREVEENPPNECYQTYKTGQILVSKSLRQDESGKKVLEPLSQNDLDLLKKEHEMFLWQEKYPDLPLLKKEYESLLKQEKPAEPDSLARMQKMIQDMEKHPDLTLPLIRMGGRGGMMGLIVLLLCFQAWRYQPRLIKDHAQAAIVVLVILLMLLAAKIICFTLRWNPHGAVLPVLIGTMIFVIAFDQRFAMNLGLVLSALVVMQQRADFAMLVILLSGVATCVFPLDEIRTRTKLMGVSAGAAAVTAGAIWINSLCGNVPWQFALQDSLWGAGAAMLVGFLVWGMLPLIERVFRVATSMTLLEWCDASKPLLKRLAMEAPGTYSHSLQLGAMCEAAAEAVGARGLLARVGAYYHDIGKINKPEYFIENQGGMASKHQKLSPAMSQLIIIGHVKDGLEMARQYGLPEILHEFITAHHGTTLIQYFYVQEAQKRMASDERAPDDVEFRYPGPKPRSREAAVLMLADACESSIRAVAEPTLSRIEAQIHAMVQRRLEDGQLEDCDLTLRQVHLIEESLVKNLCSIHHMRIAYPAPAGQKATPAETPSAEEPATNGSQPGC